VSHEYTKNAASNNSMSGAGTTAQCAALMDPLQSLERKEMLLSMEKM